jgi:Tol biopolymer transport system component/tRNA A-37 threonylcarbamoyl transferase component Bud32
MAIPLGTRLGQYTVVSFLGAGGMGEVYRATDTKLKRDVAIKVLPFTLSSDPDRLARFQREAEMLASLNHPHIAHIYGLEDIDEAKALVMELVDGTTLANRIAQSAIRVDEALSIAWQVAEALEAAHGRGIIHRDLKPANIKVQSDGTVKVLDFGLAKSMEPEGTLDDVKLSQSPTMTTPAMTEAGMILGTAAYMSPEQARGKALDKRTDIWAFGCVLYEMLTGHRAFAGKTFSDTIAAVIEREPDWNALPAATPSAVRRLLQRCLAKDPRRRLRDISDARLWMDDVASSEASVGASGSSRISRGLTWLLGAMALASASFAGWLLWVSPAEAPTPNVQLQRLTDFIGMEESPAISPDGKIVAFVARSGRKRHIWIRLLARGAPLQITRDDVDHEQPRWAPDSSSLIYFVPSATSGEHGTVWEISALGGEPPRRVASALGGGDISHDGRRIALFRIEGGQIALVVVSRDGSGAEQLRRMPPGVLYEYPRWSPDDRWIACQSSPSFAFDNRIVVVSAAADGDAKEIASGTYLRGLSWLPSGSGVVYSSPAGSTMLYPPLFNLRAVERDGTGDRQLTFGDVSYVEPDVHASGVFTGSLIRMQSDIWKFPVTGPPAENARSGVRITHQTGQARTPSASPDDSEVVYLSDSGGHSNLWIARTDGSSVRQLTFERDPAISVGVPVWSPSGNDIVFILARLGATSLWLIKHDASGLRQFASNGVFANWSADGRWIYYAQFKGNVGCIHKAPLSGTPTISLRCDDGVAPSPSSDGSTLYFVKVLSTTNAAMDEIHRARPEDGPSEVLSQVAASRAPLLRGSSGPVLSPDGKLLAMPLSDAGISNIWGLPTDGGQMRLLIDFGDRAVVIGRRVSWSRDSKFIYAAVADTDADIVLLDGLIR